MGVNRIGKGQTELGVLGVHRGVISSLSFSKDGDLLLISASDGTAKLFDVVTRNLVRVFSVDKGDVWDADLSPNEDRVATGSSDNIARIYDTNTANLLLSLEGSAENERGITRVGFAANGSRVVSSGSSRNVLLWDSETGEKVEVLMHGGDVTWVAVSPNGQWIASGSIAEGIYLHLGCDVGCQGSRTDS